MGIFIDLENETIVSDNNHTMYREIEGKRETGRGEEGERVVVEGRSFISNENDK